MKKTALKMAIVISCSMSLFSCGISNENEGEGSIALDKFETAAQMPYAYIEENTQYVPVTFNFKKTDKAGFKSIDSVAISSNKPVTVFKDINGNKAFEEGEYSITLGSGVTWLSFIEDDVTKNNNGYFTATYLLYSQTGFADNTTIKYERSVKATTLSSKETTIETDASNDGPASIVLLYDKPLEHLQIIEDEPSSLYNAKFSIKNLDNVIKVVGVENATHREDDYYYYEGLDGEITIKYELAIKKDETDIGLDPFYINKGSHFGTGEFKYSLSLVEHDHVTSLSDTVSGMNSYSCDCGYFNAYELDSSNAKDPTVPDLNNPAEMMGNQMFHVEWDVSGIHKGRYKAYVHGSTREDQKDLEWFTKLGETMSRCPCYIRINDSENQPCTSKTYGETFGQGSSWRWTNDYIFDIEIPEGLETLSIHSGNNNGNLNEWNFFFRGLLLVPFSEDFSPNNL